MGLEGAAITDTERQTDGWTNGRRDGWTDIQTQGEKDKYGEAHTRFFGLRERAKNFKFFLHITISWVSYDNVCTQY